MTTTQNMNLELLEGTDNFNTDSIKANFEKIDEQTLIPNKIVDNCVTDNSNLPLSAKQGKELQNQITQLNGNINELVKSVSKIGTTNHDGCIDTGFNIANTTILCIKPNNSPNYKLTFACNNHGEYWLTVFKTWNGSMEIVVNYEFEYTIVYIEHNLKS